jgi:hypothetical protein
MKDGKFFHFATIETEEATLKEAKEAYDKLVEKNGKAALRCFSGLVSPYRLLRCLGL